MKTDGRLQTDGKIFGSAAFSRSPSSALLPSCLGEGSPTKINYRKKGTLILTSLLEDLVLPFCRWDCPSTANGKALRFPRAGGLR